MPGPAGRRVFVLALGRTLGTFPAALSTRHYLQIFKRLLSHCKTASMPAWCSQAVSGVLWVEVLAADLGNCRRHFPLTGNKNAK